MLRTSASKYSFTSFAVSSLQRRPNFKLYYILKTPLGRHNCFIIIGIVKSKRNRMMPVFRSRIPSYKLNTELCIPWSWCLKWGFVTGFQDQAAASPEKKPKAKPDELSEMSCTTETTSSWIREANVEPLLHSYTKHVLVSRNEYFFRLWHYADTLFKWSCYPCITSSWLKRTG